MNEFEFCISYLKSLDEEILKVENPSREFLNEKLLKNLTILKENYFLVGTSEPFEIKFTNSLKLINELLRITQVYVYGKKGTTRKLKLPFLIEEINLKDIDIGLLYILKISEKRNTAEIAELQKKLVDLGLYPNSIKSYRREIRKGIIESAFSKNRKSPKSFYLEASSNSEENFKYLKSRIHKYNIIPQNLELVDNTFIEKNEKLLTVLKINKSEGRFKKISVQKQLVESGFYNECLEQMPDLDKEKICQSIIDKSKTANFNSFYLEISQYKEINFKEFINSKTFTTSIPDIIEKLDSKYFKRIKKILKLFDIKELTVKNMQQRFVELRIYESNLAELAIDKKEEICKYIITQSRSASFTSYYLNYSPDKEKNKEIFLESKEFKEFKKKADRRKVKRIIKRFELGNTKRKTFSLVQAKWNPEEERKLLQRYTFNRNFLNETSEEEILKEFGRSKDALDRKIRTLIEEKVENTYSEEDDIFKEVQERGLNSFPKVLKKYIKEILNDSLIIQNNNVPEIIPIITSYYPYKNRNGDSSFLALLPIEFKGNNFNNYLNIEKEILTIVYSKLFDYNCKEYIIPNRIVKINTPSNTFIEKLLMKRIFLCGVYIKTHNSLNKELETKNLTFSLLNEKGEEKKVNFWFLNED